MSLRSQEDGAWVVATEPRLSVGGYDSREEYLLHHVADATRVSDGGVVVADFGSSELKKYSRDGVHVWTVGGPGEMSALLQLERISGDTLLALSTRPGLSWYTHGGRFLRSHSINLHESLVECRAPEASWRVLQDGSVISVLFDFAGIPGCQDIVKESPFKRTGLIVRQDGAATHLIASMPAGEYDDKGLRPFSATLAIGLGSDRIYATDTAGDSIFGFGLTGDTLSRWLSPFERARILRDDPGLRQSASLFEGTELPELSPRVGRLLVDEEGHLWVMGYPQGTGRVYSEALQEPWGSTIEPGGSIWRVLGLDGRVRAAVRTPDGVYPLEIGADYVLGLRRDELGAETLVLHDLIR